MENLGISRKEKLESFYCIEAGRDGEELVKEIYNDFENRICKNCKYYVYLSKENGKTKNNAPYHRCEREEIDADGGWFEPPNKDFGCNLFEEKKDESM